MIHPVLFFRRPNPGYHSIEELFQTLLRYFPDDIAVQEYVLPCKSTGIISRVRNVLAASWKSGRVNHITGDIHYIALLLPRKRTILTIHDLEIIKRSTGLKRAVIKFFWFTLPTRRVRYITVISEFTRSELLRYVHIAPEKIIIVPNCISADVIYQPNAFQEDCPVILQVGTKENKNLPNLIKALKGLSCTLIVLGELTREQVLLLKNNNIRYENHTSLSYGEVLQLYRKADILAFVSSYEGFGLPILEAQATGRVVITSKLSSMPEVAGEGALLVDPFNSEAIRDAVVRLTGDPALREQLIAKGLLNVKRYQPGHIAGLYAQLYREIAGGDC